MSSPSRGTTRSPSAAAPYAKVERAAAAVATLVLLALGIAYYLTYEPAPEVVIRWRDGTTWQRRATLERRFGLVQARDIADWTVWYDLVDIRPANIRSLAGQPEVAGTQGLDLETYSIPPDGPYGKGWMWIGPRLPILRHRGVVPVVVIVCVLTIGYVVVSEVRAQRERLLEIIDRLRASPMGNGTRQS